MPHLDEQYEPVRYSKSQSEAVPDSELDVQGVGMHIKQENETVEMYVGGYEGNEDGSVESSDETWRIRNLDPVYFDQAFG